ncbi:MAG: hypothetical protein KKH92_07670 [Firmicutes bacterium]|nr:hypothetical protein [Bacillota bacterium]
MKKLFIILVLFLGAITISGCANTGDGYGFKNTSKQTKAEIQEKIQSYSDQLKANGGGLLNSNQSLSSDSGDEFPEDTPKINREDLPPEYDYPYDPDVVDPFFTQNAAMILDLYHEALDLCDEFEEDVFCTINYDEYDLYLRVKNEEEQLFIEAYHYHSTSSFGGNSFVNAELMYLNRLDEKVYFELVRDFRERSGDYEIHNLYYDRYYESGDMLNISLNMNAEFDVYYQNYVRENHNVFLFSNSEEGRYYNYKDTATNKFHSLGYRDGIEVSNRFVGYGTHNPTFRYSFNWNSIYPPIQLTWNTLDITGWDSVELNENAHDRIFSGSEEVLADFSSVFSVYEDIMTAETYIFVHEEEITQGLISLSDYGLSFGNVTIEELISDIPFLENNYARILEEYGFVEDMAQNKTILLNMFPYLGNQDIIDELFNK